MTEAEAAPSEIASPRPRIGPFDIACGIGLSLGIVASWVFIALTPSLLKHHGILLEALAGSNAAIVSGGAFARVGRDSLVLVILAPICTIALYDVFFWWAGHLWGDRIVEFYAANNPRAAKWLTRAEQLVRRGGIWTLVIAYYLIPIPRILIFLSCGASGMPVALFLLGDLIGLLLWETLLIGLGWAIGHPAVHIVDEVARYSLRVTIALVVLIILVAVIRQRRAGPDST